METTAGSEIAVIIATLNEEEGLGPTVVEIQRFLNVPYILVVDGNSVDRTVEIAKALGLKVIFQEGRGKGCALASALNSLKATPRFIVFIDADFTYPAEYLPSMVKILKEKPEVGMVCGCRFDKPFKFANVRSPYYVGNRFLSAAQYLMNGVAMRDPLTGLRVVRWEILRDWKPHSRGFDIEAELNFIVERRGYKIVEIPIHYRDRLGEKKLKIKHGFIILKRIIVGSLHGNQSAHIL
jgi:glycosyltransferase involved in cell wall biosynthesis